MNGKDKCEELKRIRKELAQQNDIEYNPADCTHEGSCSGVCPTCQKEADYILEELQKRIDAGEPVNMDVDLEDRLSQVEDEEELGNTDDPNIAINSDGMVPEPEILMGEPYLDDMYLQGCIPAPRDKDDDDCGHDNDIDDCF